MGTEQSPNSIKERVLGEMVSKREEDQSVVQKILTNQFDSAKKLFALREDGKVTIENLNAPAESQVLCYLLGAAYARVADLRTDDGVQNGELTEELRLNENTTRVAVKSLRDDGLIVRKANGLHRIDYRKIAEIVQRISTKAPRRLPSRTSGPNDVFGILARSGQKGLIDYLQSLDAEGLKSIIVQHRLDPTGKALKWQEKERLTDFTLSRIQSRAKHGEVFLERKPRQPSKKSERQPSEEKTAAALALPSKGTQGILEFTNREVRFPTSAFENLTFEEAIGLLLLEVGAPLTATQIANLISRGFKRIDHKAVRAYLNQERRKLRRYVIREEEGYRLTGEGANWVKNEVIPKLQGPP